MNRIDILQLSVQEIHDRFVGGGEPVTAHLLITIQKDRRAGVRKIYHLLKKKKQQERDEQLRLEAMLNFERVLWKSGVRHIAGVDEVGVGPLAGPVAAAAVIFPPQISINGIDDSKRLDPGQRVNLAAKIREQALGIGIGIAEVEEIDQINIYQAGILAMKRAVENLPVKPDHILTDAREIPDLRIPQNPFHKGDGINFSIAAASIIAKIHRDQLMDDLDRIYPRYGFSRHKGYSTPEHQRAIRDYGPSPVHRKSFRFMQELCGHYTESFYWLKDRLYRAGTIDALTELERELKDACRALPEQEQRKLKLVLARRWKVLAAV